MSRQANPTLIGAFVLGAILLGAMTVLLLAGGQWFQKRSQHILYFEGAAQGLQIGAPVVFLGVKVGTVKRIQLGLDTKIRRFMVPVTIEVEPNMVHSSRGEEVDLRDRETIRQLVKQGLRGQLKMQSLLTGQLYVDLNFHPDKLARFFAPDSEVSEIPTIPTAAEELASKLEGFPMDTFLADLAAISRSLNTILSSEAAKMIPVRLEATLATTALGIASGAGAGYSPVAPGTAGNLVAAVGLWLPAAAPAIIQWIETVARYRTGETLMLPPFPKDQQDVLTSSREPWKSVTPIDQIRRKGQKWPR